VNGILYISSTERQWRAIPKDLPPGSTLFDYLDLWSFEGTLDRMHHSLYVKRCKRDEREASPTAAIIDSQGVKSAETGGRASISMVMMQVRRSMAKKQHILADTLDLLLHAIIHPADVQDRDSGILLLSTLSGMYPFLEKPFADGGD
jgi:transposase